MGAVGVHTGRGQITGTQVTNLKDATGVLRDKFRDANSLVIFPYNFTSIESTLNSLNKYSDKIDIANAVRGYAIAMSGATQSQKDNFISKLNTMMQREEARGENGQIQQAISRILANNPNLNSAQRRVVEEIVRSTIQRQMIDRMVAADNRRGGRRFGGHIRTRNIRRDDFDKA